MLVSKITLAFGLCAGLAACGNTTGEQVVIGAGAGLLGSALIGGSLVTGAAVGTAANLIYCKENPGRC
ncbi:hypothetical protein [Parasedimentitalea psychrophila]|uniref:Lipoprotein n=1 Tax=Parasedimentitalea psychrophila TaxID=2997337 RepID=A0A9Y2KZE2_9RHOB|nr:hypothetical protein [Parasedimentitalea psychrophila]WIY23989.1 hypothetical protein QPJ95_15350 [Parasedimentitalea psychrophila]